jgi:UPF0755 protein
VRRALFMTSILFATLLLGAAWWFGRQLETPFFGAPSPEVFLDVPHGAGSSTIAELLSDAGLIRWRLPFELYVRAAGLARHMQAGEYRFDRPATPIEIARRMAAGDIYRIAVTVPEGLTSRETIDLLAKSGVGNPAQLQSTLKLTGLLRDLDPAANDLEGFLFPDTYRFSRKSTADDIVKDMVENFRMRYKRLLAQYPLPAGWDAGNIVTLASLVEKEVQAPEERGLVASVLINRLEKRMPLGCDATIIFALKQTGAFQGSLHKADMSLPSPYNTYLHIGLPPGPIACPGEASLIAALKPAHSEYLYYVSRNDGTHQFSKTYEAHLAAVHRYQRAGARHSPRSRVESPAGNRQPRRPSR